MSYYITSCYIIWCYIMSCHVMSYHVILCSVADITHGVQCWSGVWFTNSLQQKYMWYNTCSSLTLILQPFSLIWYIRYLVQNGIAVCVQTGKQLEKRKQDMALVWKVLSHLYFQRPWKHLWSMHSMSTSLSLSLLSFPLLFPPLFSYSYFLSFSSLVSLLFHFSPFFFLASLSRT